MFTWSIGCAWRAREKQRETQMRIILQYCQSPLFVCFALPHRIPNDTIDHHHVVIHVNKLI